MKTEQGSSNVFILINYLSKLHLEGFASLAPNPDPKNSHSGLIGAWSSQQTSTNLNIAFYLIVLYFTKETS